MSDDRRKRTPPIPPSPGTRPAVPPRLPHVAPPTQTRPGERAADPAPPTITGDGTAKRSAVDPAARRLDRTIIDPRAPEPEPAPAAPLRITPGLRIGDYELIRELGRGGMGQVFLARDTKLGRRVAIKFLLAPSQRFTSRFHVEARATARVSHEHIVTIYVTGEHEGMPYMVLEYVEGKTLGALMADQRLPVARAIELIVPVVRALERAHAENIVHRDLKPDNIIVSASGTVKVLDFGVAKLFATENEDSGRRPHPPSWPGDLDQTRSGAIVGTLPYMSPEQLGMDEVDHRSDLWAVGIMLYQMLAGHHPLDPVTQGRLFGAAAALDEPMPSLGDDAPGLPDRLVEAVARCLAKRKDQRYTGATELLAALEPLLPTRAGKSLAGDESPYPGLHAFQEVDANRFFGRGRDIAALLARLRDHPLIGVVGPSGVGKSSFVRAGVVPALKSTGEAWEVLIVRPGRSPLAALASAMESLRDTRDSDPTLEGDPAATLRAEPGVFGARLRARARRRRAQILVFVDQHEELYTMVPDAEERRAFTKCLAAAGDDPSGPIRVVLSMRSDFLDRAAEDRRFVAELTGGLVFLQPLGREGLQEALVAPLEALGFSFEAGVVPQMLDALEATPGALPLLQFSAARLWDQRDRQRRVLTREAYVAMGGVAGALATHADEVLAALPAPDQHVVRAIFQRLVTPERTRAIVDASELRDLSPEVDRLLAHLVAARLLVMQKRGDGERSVEIVHESLIRSWPQLGRWLDENQEDAAYLAQLGAASRQWDAKGRAAGLLWRDEAMLEARQWHARYQGDLPAREQAFLDAVFAQARRARWIRRSIAAVIAAVAMVALVIINAERRSAEQSLAEFKQATHLTSLAEANAKKAEAQVKAAQAEKQAAQAQADETRAKAAAAEADAHAAASQAQAAALREEAAKAAAAREAAAAAKNAAAAKHVQQHNSQITTELK
jgi:serine/threonine protein kinase